MVRRASSLATPFAMLLGSAPAAAHPGHGRPGLLHWAEPEHLAFTVLLVAGIALALRALRRRGGRDRAA
jgi:hypothetical protein